MLDSTFVLYSNSMKISNVEYAESDVHGNLLDENKREIMDSLS